MKEEKTTMMKQLVEQLNNASQAYYNGEAELMSDYEWDSKFDQLKLLEDETGIVLPDSPTNKVSEDSISGRSDDHLNLSAPLDESSYNQAGFIGCNRACDAQYDFLSF